MRMLWGGRRSHELTPWAGLAFGALYLVALTAAGMAGARFQQQAVVEQQQADARLWTYWLAKHLAELSPHGPEVLARELRQAAREPGVTYCAVVDKEGRQIAGGFEYDTPGQAGPVFDLLEGAGLRVESGISPDRPGETMLRSRIASPTGGSEGHSLLVGVTSTPRAWTESRILYWTGYILLGVLGLYLLLYHQWGRALRPLAVVGNRLRVCREDIVDRLAALRVNDTLDEVTSGWNRVLDTIGRMHEEIGQCRLTDDTTAAMDRYRSERLTTLLMQIPFGLLVVSEDRTVRFANRAAGTMLGTLENALEGQSIDKLLDAGLLMALLPGGRAVRTTASAMSRWTDATFDRPRGKVTLRFWSSPMGAGSPEHILFVQDVTQAKEAERARDSFLYHVTHELRTPLTNIRAYAETLSQGVIDDEQTIRECYNVIMGETGRLNRLVEDILNVSQLEVGTARMNAGEVQLAEVLRKVVQDNQGNADAHNIDLVLRLPAKLPKLRGDRERLAVVFNNLIGNAVKYTPDGGRVEVRVSADQDHIEVAVSDTGIGIRPEDQEKVFDKFYRVDDERVNKITGTGLGLSIARETVRAHGGTIGVESRLNEGSTFTVSLPALPLDGPAGGSASPSREPAVVPVAASAAGEV